MEKQTKEKQKPIVVFDNVYKAFGDLVVLDGLNLRVAPNENIVIIGPSGSGKTTILRTLMTLEKPDSGYIYVNGETLWHMDRGGRKSLPMRIIFAKCAETLVWFSSILTYFHICAFYEM